MSYKENFRKRLYTKTIPPFSNTILTPIIQTPIETGLTKVIPETLIEKVITNVIPETLIKEVLQIVRPIEVSLTKVIPKTVKEEILKKVIPEMGKVILQIPRVSKELKIQIGLVIKNKKTELRYLLIILAVINFWTWFC